MTDKNRARQAPTFANINFIGQCQHQCIFCLGREARITSESTLYTHLPELLSRGLDAFVTKCLEHDIQKVYLTGLNCDPLQYGDLRALIRHLQDRRGVKVGIRTNGVLAEQKLQAINEAELTTSYTIHSLDENLHRRIALPELGVPVPLWGRLLGRTKRWRVSMVVTAFNCGLQDVLSLVRFIRTFGGEHRLQVRCAVHEKGGGRDKELFDVLQEEVCRSYPLVSQYYTGSNTYLIEGVMVNFWNPFAVTINSLNFFADGRSSDNYHIVEGYNGGAP